MGSTDNYNIFHTSPNENSWGTNSVFLDLLDAPRKKPLDTAYDNPGMEKKD